MKLFNILFLALFIISCNFDPSNSNYVPPDVNWLNSDELPSLKGCDDFESEQKRKDCFESAILSSIYSNLDLSSIVVSSEINDTIFLSLLIDKSGDLSLIDIEKSDNLIPYIPTLELLVRESIKKAPSLYPATKTNIGVPVSTKIKLPLIIKSN